MRNKLISTVLAVIIILLLFPFSVFSSTAELLQEDAEAIALSGVLDEGYVLPRQGQNGSEITWKSSVAGMFDESGMYLPQIGENAFELTLVATLSLMGETLKREFNLLSYRTPAYRINGFVYQKEDGSKVRHPMNGARVISASIEKNLRVQDDAVLICGIYENGQLCGISYNKIEQSGEIALNCPLGASIEMKELRAFIFDHFDQLKPLADPYKIILTDAANNDFYKKAKAKSEDGEDASAVLDQDENTSYHFHKEVIENDRGMSLYLNQPDNTQSQNQSASYIFKDKKQGKITFSQDFLITETEGEKGLLYLYDGDDYVLSLLILGSTVVNERSQVIATNIKPYFWNKLYVELDTEMKTARVSVNSGEEKELPFRTKTADGVTRFQIHNSAKTVSGIYLDCVQVMVEGDICLFENFDAYQAGVTQIDGWTFISKGVGTVQTAEFKDSNLSIFPQSLVVDIGRECDIGSIGITFPQDIKVRYRLETSRNNVDYVRVASHMEETVTGTSLEELTRVRMRYLRLIIYYAEDSFGRVQNGEVSEIKFMPTSSDTPSNVARFANVSVTSSYYDRSQQNDLYLYDERGLIDGIAASFTKKGEWLAYRECNPTAYFSWDTTQSVDEVLVFGRNAEGESVSKVVLTFDDGDIISVEDIPKNGLPKSVKFWEKQVNWMSVRLYGAESSIIGLSEIQVITRGDKSERVKYLAPQYTIKVPNDYGGEWVVSDDLNGDGFVEFVSARVYYEGDNHEVAAACAFNLDGHVLWTWGTAREGQDRVSSDVPCQIYDIDFDGEKEVLLATHTHLIILNGKTGLQELSFALPLSERYPNEWSSDSIIIADIVGDGYANDIIVKTRYTDIWAYCSPSNWQTEDDVRLIWHTCMPNQMCTAHYPLPIDIDHDGCDEVFVGFAIMDDDGNLISQFDTNEFASPIATKHIDSIAVINFETGMSKEDMRFAISPCGARNFFVVDGNCKKIFEIESGIHYETLLLGKFTFDGTNQQILTNDVSSVGDSIGGTGFEEIHIYNEDGSLQSTFRGFTTNRYIHSINMTSEGFDYIYQPSDHVLIDGEGCVRVRLVSPYQETITAMRWSPFKGYNNDMNGDGTEDIVSLSKRSDGWYITVYLNSNGTKTADKLGTGYNYSLY